MPIVDDAIVMRAPAEKLFALSQDYALRREWDPFVREMRFQDGATEAARGVRVWVRAWTGLTMEVVFTSFQPPRSVAMKMVRGPAMFEHFAGTWLFEEIDETATQVTFRYSYSLRWKWLSPIVSWMFRRDVRARLAGLKRGAERGGLFARLRQPCG